MRWIFVFALAGLTLAQQQKMTPEQQDFRRRTMEVLTPEERAHLQSNGAVDRAKWMAEHPARESTGLIPLPDLGKGMYKGEQGGLYPGGVNVPPPEHIKAGLAAAKSIVPLDAEGHPSPDGKIVLISVGMSNTTMKFQAFQRLARQQGGLNPHLVIVDGAQGSQVAWITSKANAPFWEVVMKRLGDAGVTPAQVQAAWMLQANPGPHDAFPIDMKELQKNIEDTLLVMKNKFPNLKVSYLSSRTYAGYASSPLNPEPYAYENGLAVKWAVSGQISGKGPVHAPWIAWGPYLWADGVKPNSYGLNYVKDDYSSNDGTHPTPSGQMKVAERLMTFFKTDPTTKTWFLPAK